MYVGVDDDGLLDTRYDDESTASLMKRVPEVVLLKVPDEIREIGRGFYKYKVVDGAFIFKEDLTDCVKQNKQAIINSYRSKRDELLSQTD